MRDREVGSKARHGIHLPRRFEGNRSATWRMIIRNRLDHAVQLVLKIDPVDLDGPYLLDVAARELLACSSAVDLVRHTPIAFLLDLN